MTWIHKHWDADYIATAKGKIRELVSLYIWGCPKKRHHLSPCKMLEYHEKAAHRHEEEEEPLLDESSPNLGDSGHPSGEAWMSLMKQYGIESEMSTDNRDNNTQSVDEEYNAYVTAQCSRPGTDILSFWSVSGDINSA